jgi:hypothetical protein
MQSKQQIASLRPEKQNFDCWYRTGRWCSPAFPDLFNMYYQVGTMPQWRGSYDVLIYISEFFRYVRDFPSPCFQQME